MQVSVFGLGYVGAVSAACLAADGHQVIGVDSNPQKVDLINAGLSPVVEPGLTELIAREVARGRLSATSDHRRAVSESDIALICVGTPSRPNGDIESVHLASVARQMGEVLADRDGFFVISVRSTSFPGTTERRVIHELERASGKVAGEDFGVCFNPEFLREGSSISDYYNPSRVVVGGTDDRSIKEILKLYGGIDAPVVTTDIPHSEMIKYIDNAWHALKVGFANEVGRLSKTLGLDSRVLMEVFALDTKLNISDKYLKPGFAFGGSCLPKDLRALIYRAGRLDLDLPIMRSILPSNRVHIDWAIDMITATGARSVGVLGLSFKPETDDLRESPMVTVVERLIGKGFRVQIFDPVVQLGSLTGANREYLLRQIPHVASLLVEDIGEVVRNADTIVIGTAHESVKEVVDAATPSQPIVDLVAMLPGTRSDGGDYVGIAW